MERSKGPKSCNQDTLRREKTKDLLGTDPASPPVFLLALSTLTPGKSEALGTAVCFLSLDLELLSLPVGQGAALGTWGGLGVLP